MNEEFISVFFNKKHEKHYTIRDDIYCKHCEKIIKNNIYYQKLVSPFFKINYFCEICKDKIGKEYKNNNTYNELGFIIITNKIPPFSYPVRLDSMPTLHNTKGTSVFDIKTINEKCGGSETIDNTKLAGKTEFNPEIEAKVRQREIDFEAENNGDVDYEIKEDEFDNIMNQQIEHKEEDTNGKQIPPEK